MTRWKHLPADLDPQTRRLVTQLRALKDRTGLSYAALAAKTAFSKSSWERYLNGRALPPVEAVQALGRLANADANRLRALWDFAEEAYSGRQAAAAGGAEPAGEGGAAGAAGVPPREREGAGAAGDAGDSGTAAASGAGGAAGVSGGAGTAGAPRASGGGSGDDFTPTPGGRSPGGGPSGRGGPLLRRRAVLLTSAALVTACAVLAAVIVLQDGDSSSQGRGDGAGSGSPPASPGASAQSLPATEVGCRGAACAGKDPKAMGCDQVVWTPAATWVYGTYVEVRYSPDCRAAWGRISSASVGDGVRVASRDGAEQANRIRFEADTYTPMVAASRPSAVRACAELKTAKEGCTAWGGPTPVSVPQPAPAG